MHFSSLNEVTNLFFIILLWLSFLEINLFYNLRMPSFDNIMKENCLILSIPLFHENLL